MISDISLSIKPGMLTWPKEDWVACELMTDFEVKGVRVSKVSLGSHTGTHIDAPRHFLKDGYGVDSIPVEKLVGPCTVIEISADKDCITDKELQGIAFEKRVLFKTRNSAYLRDTEFFPDYVYLAESGAKYLLEKGVELVAIDYLSIEKRGAPGHPVHTMLLEKGVVIVEGADLANVAPGNYTIMALPLKLAGMDGAPARVLLMK